MAGFSEALRAVRIVLGCVRTEGLGIVRKVQAMRQWKSGAKDPWVRGLGLEETPISQRKGFIGAALETRERLRACKSWARGSPEE